MSIKKSDKKAIFHKFFLKIKDKLKLKNDMEDVLWKYLVAIKHDTADLFSEGVKKFGYKL